jgi:hypothetical protein
MLYLEMLSTARAERIGLCRWIPVNALVKWPPRFRPLVQLYLNFCSGHGIILVIFLLFFWFKFQYRCSLFYH